MSSQDRPSDSAWPGIVSILLAVPLLLVELWFAVCTLDSYFFLFGYDLCGVDALLPLTLWGGCLAMPMSLAGLILGIVSWRRRGKRRLFLVLGIVLNGLLLLVACGVILLASIQSPLPRL